MPISKDITLRNISFASHLDAHNFKADILYKMRHQTEPITLANIYTSANMESYEFEDWFGYRDPVYLENRCGIVDYDQETILELPTPDWTIANELAEKIGITPANLSVLKTGKAKAVRFSTLEKICEVLNCQPGDILEYDPTRPGTEEQEE